MSDLKRRIRLSTVIHDNGEAYLKRGGCRGAEYYRVKCAMARMLELRTAGFGLEVWLYFVAGDGENDFYLPTQNEQLEWKCQLKQIGASRVEISIANIVMKDGSSTNLPEFYWLRDRGMIGWKPSSRSCGNDIDRQEKLVGSDSMIHNSLYQEYGLTPDQY